MAQWEKGQSGNKAGRPKGSGVKVPTHEQLIEEVSKGNMKAFKKAMSIMSNGSENNQLKAAFKVMDIYVTLTKNKDEDVIHVTKSSTDKHNSDNVVPLISAEYKG